MSVNSLNSSAVQISSIVHPLLIQGFRKHGNTVAKAEGQRKYMVTFSRQRSWDEYFVVIGMDFEWVERSFKLTSALGCMILCDIGHRINSLCSKSGNSVDFKDEKLSQIPKSELTACIEEQLGLFRQRSYVEMLIENKRSGFDMGVAVSPHLLTQLDAIIADKRPWW